MIDDASPYGRPVRRFPRRRLRGDMLAMTAAAGLALGALPRPSAPPETQPAVASHPAPTTAEAPAVDSTPPGHFAWMLDPAPALGDRTLAMRPVAALGSALEPAPAAPSPVAGPPVTRPLADAEPVRAPAVQQTARLVQAPPSQLVPLPVRRPAALQAVQTAAANRLADRPRPAGATLAARENAEAERSFFDTVFGAKPSAPGPALAYAGVDEEGLGTTPRRPPAASAKAGLGTAVYDISASRVYLPSGEALEAHSGLGPSMDDPRYVHLKMRGATPPGTYELTEREALFHGVRALRLNPVGGSAAIHNRVGLLTHTYMLGPSGASNGCVSFKNYARFLQAYLSGEVRRLVVVAGARQDAFPAFADRVLGR